jgi:hypothetical protein
MPKRDPTRIHIPVDNACAIPLTKPAMDTNEAVDSMPPLQAAIFHSSPELHLVRCLLLLETLHAVAELPQPMSPTIALLCPC